jgi:hypothetical protein
MEYPCLFFGVYVQVSKIQSSHFILQLFSIHVKCLVSSFLYLSAEILIVKVSYANEETFCLAHHWSQLAGMPVKMMHRMCVSVHVIFILATTGESEAMRNAYTSC